MRRWDAETAVNVDTFNGSKAVYCVAAAPEGSERVAFGGAERALHVWDPRTPIGRETVSRRRNYKDYLLSSDPLM